MDNNESEVRRFLVIALIAAIAYSVVGPVGLACVALVLLLKKSKNLSDH